MPHVELPQAEFKLVMLGETFTGKTSLVLRFAEGYYRESSRNPTVGAFFITKRLTVQGMTAKIQIWDTAGQEQFKKLAPMYYKNAAAAIICYDVTSPKSFETLEYWMNKLQQNVPPGGIVIAMCATKCDLEEDPDTSQAEKLAEETGAIFLKTSSKTNSNVHSLFQKVTERVMDYQRKNAGLSNAEIPVTLGAISPPTTPSRGLQKESVNENAKTIRSDDKGLSPTIAAPENSPFIDEKKIDIEETNDVVDGEKDVDDDDSIKHVYSRCDTTKLMCGQVVGVADDGTIAGCVLQ
mmetsp:Transcript_7139/g.17410  ORF Transcript_7139/g.17410 Transcript_7139/m.17410 type:complete len:294 (-) Transcript_7139:1487-2368(-)|eukprot:CAMPEP_0197194106 /NCGR_PEP_ID=MMETSP1423-20130617/28672_1 /TAXON_ID=476441 /ORGANISM="Pseudo-nitzschia heimii, Strain UNC1101" /LENGTH=293 /DNA_ID=CAMNT_0042647477 /DNA_START=151 /DNA_END=1032 /DNA_ORIENTATION=+